MLSIRPEWVEKILDGEKTIEIRKTMPARCELPCKVYIYCTKGIRPCMYGWRDAFYPQDPTLQPHQLNGKVVAEFTLKNVVKFDIESLMFLGKQQELMQKSCLGGMSLRKYLGNKVGYAWGIDDLKIYNKPKELHEFGVYDERYSKARKCSMPGWFPLRRPPQSYCYIDLKDEEK